MARMSPVQYVLAFLLWYLAVALHPTSSSASRHLNIDHTGSRGFHHSSSSLKASHLTGNYSEGQGRRLGGSDDTHDGLGEPLTKGSNSAPGVWRISEAAYMSDNVEEEGGSENEKPGFLTHAADVDATSGRAEQEEEEEEDVNDKVKSGARGSHQGRNPTLSPRPSLRERRSTAPWFTVGLLPAQSLSTSGQGSFRGKMDGDMESLEENKNHLGRLGKSWSARNEDLRAEGQEPKMLDAMEEAEEEEEEATAAVAAGRVGGGVALRAGFRSYPVRNLFPAVMPFLQPPTAKRHTGRLSINGALSSLADMLLAESYRREGASMRSGLHNAGRRR